MRINEDSIVDNNLASYVKLEELKSFFLLAGAGSGKTRSLVNLLKHIEKDYGNSLKEQGKKVAVITYTKAASEEIKNRLSDHSKFHVSTIHSFAWSLIEGFNLDIKESILKKDKNSLDQLKQKKITKASSLKIDKLEQKIANVHFAKRFLYNPDSNIQSLHSLNHQEVLDLFAEFLTNKPVMQKLITQMFPIILIDECQDTDKKVMEAFLLVEKTSSDFCLGLFGDMMQRIYNGGKEDLIDSLKDWEQPTKILNWRSYNRIVQFINSIRKNVDSLVQKPVYVENDGIVRIYITDKQEDFEKFENDIFLKVKDKIKENDLDINAGIIKLILEHKMAAIRYGFDNFFTPLYTDKKLKNGILDGSLKEYKFLRDIVIALFDVYRMKDKFAIAKIIKTKSELFRDTHFNQQLPNQFKEFKGINARVEQFLAVFDSKIADPNAPLSLIEIISHLQDSELFVIPERLHLEDISNRAWVEALDADFNELLRYNEYINKVASFVTQQGSKGLEYPHVAVIIDDKSASGNLFKYEKLFEVASKTEADYINEKEGKETSLDRTRRLLYVACSRAKESLTLIVYTENPLQVKNFFIENGLAIKEEVELVEIVTANIF